MPELLTKHPDTALDVLRSQGAQCGAGITPKILTSCPQDRFCMLQGGELCVYGVQDLDLMTQLTRAEICGPIPQPQASTAQAGPAVGIGLVLAAVLGFAFVTGRARRRQK